MVRIIGRCLFALLAVMSPMTMTLLAADGGAMLHATGDVTVDNHPVTDSTAVLTGSVIETKPGAVANLNLSGSTLTIQPETLLKFSGDDMYLDHGSVTVASSAQLRVHVKCINASPAGNAWTQFSVAHLNGTVQVAALKNSVGISYGSESILAKAVAGGASATSSQAPITLAEGQQFNRYEMDGCPVQGRQGAQSAASGSVFSSPVTQIAAGATAGGILIWVVTRGGGNSISPTEP